jgi:hypothetical protein
MRASELALTKESLRIELSNEATTRLVVLSTITYLCSCC